MNKPSLFQDSYIMFKRCFKKMLRSPETIIMATLVPVFMMIMFGYVLGGVAQIDGFSYINFIVPGIILQCIANSSAATGLNVHADMSTGIIDRFRSMAIAKSAVISGHVWVSVIRSILITAFAIGAAFVIGFRPVAGFTAWMLIILIMFLVIFAITWLAVVIGLTAKNAESISGGTFLLVVFTFLSSGFAPTDTMPLVLRVFAEHQPMTPIINALRGLMMDMPMNGYVWQALVWCIGISILAFILAVKIYKQKMTR